MPLERPTSQFMTSAKQAVSGNRPSDKLLIDTLKELNKTLAVARFMTSAKSAVSGNRPSDKLLIDTLKFLQKTMIISNQRDTVRRRKEDPNIIYLKNIDMNMKNFVKLSKEKEKKGGGLLGLLGFVSKALMVGGLLGFLFTGKKEMLFSVVKGFTQSFGRLGIWITSTLFKAAGGLVGGIGKSLGIKALGTGGKVLANIGKVGLKFLKALPGVGALLGLIFGISRFRKGDTVGGLLEIGSGLVGLIPFAGLPLSMAINAVILTRDVVGKEKFDKGAGKVAGKVASWGIEQLKKIPGVGTIINFVQGIKEAVKDPIGAMKKIAGMIPGAEDVIGMASGLFDFFKGNKGATTGTPTGGSNATGDGFMGGMFKPTSMVGKLKSRAKTGYKATSGAISGVVSKIADIVSRASGKAGNMIKSFGGATGILPNSSSLDFSGMNPSVLQNFMGMAHEYKEKTGKSILVNSAYRDPIKQKQLYEESLRNGRAGFVAKPGNSPHGIGAALDVNTYGADALESSGLLRKWGFWRPLMQPGVKHRESWHIEPVGLRKGGQIQPDTFNQKSQVGDYPLSSNVKGNLPSMSIPTNNNGKNSISLSDETITKLANKFKEAVIGIPQPKFSQAGSHIYTTARG